MYLVGNQVSWYQNVHACTVRYVGGIEMGIGASIICDERLRDSLYRPAEEAPRVCQMWPNSRLPPR
jgi:hypothetical protein